MLYYIYKGFSEAQRQISGYREPNFRPLRQTVREARPYGMTVTAAFKALHILTDQSCRGAQRAPGRELYIFVFLSAKWYNFSMISSEIRTFSRALNERPYKTERHRAGRMVS